MGFLTPQARGEHAVLKTFALQQLAQLRTTVTGLTDEQAHSTPTASALNLTGLLRHCGMVAVLWATSAAHAPEPPRLPTEFGEDPTLDTCVEDARPLAEILDEFDRCVAFAAARIDEVSDLSAQVPVPDAPWYPDDLKTWDARWAITHIAAEVARHTGHADIIRESIDGKGAFELNDLAEREG